MAEFPQKLFGWPLRIDFRGHAARGILIRANARLAPAAILVVPQVPDVAAAIDQHAADPKRSPLLPGRFLAGVFPSGRLAAGTLGVHQRSSRGEVSRYKAPQKRHKRELFGRSPKRNCPCRHDL